MVTSVSTNSASFSWDEVPCGERRGNIIQYQCRLENTADSNDNAQMNVLDKMVEFKELRPCTTYNFTVAAVTMIGVGPMNRAQQVTTDAISKLGSFVRLL